MLESFEEKMKSCVFFIEANDNERHELWSKWVRPTTDTFEEICKILEKSKEESFENWKLITKFSKLKYNMWGYGFNREDWEEDSFGTLLQIGKLYEDEDKFSPVCVSFSFAKWFGQRVCFYYPTSRYVDNTMIEEWIKTNYPKKYDNDRRWAMTDSTNVHHAISECERLVNIK